MAINKYHSIISQL